MNHTVTPHNHQFTGALKTARVMIYIALQSRHPVNQSEVGFVVGDLGGYVLCLQTGDVCWVSFTKTGKYITCSH